MKAVIFEEYGSPEVLKIKDIDKPEPKEDQILVKIYSTSVTTGDARLRRADPFLSRIITGIFNPKKQILGINLSGVIEKIGKDVTNFKVGDRVFGSSGMGFASHAEYICLNNNSIITKLDKEITYNEASSVIFGGLTAFHFLEKANIKEGQQILIYGASGSVGNLAVQIAANMGANVTAVCSEENKDLVLSIGANSFIDYKKQNIQDITGKYDYVYDTVGKISFKSSVHLLKNLGTYISNDARVNDYFQLLKNSIFGGYKIILGIAEEKIENLEKIQELIKKNSIKPQIDTIYSLEEIIKAHKHVESRHKKGDIIIDLQK